MKTEQIPAALRGIPIKDLREIDSASDDVVDFCRRISDAYGVELSLHTADKLSRELSREGST